jgi:hypothetical protein
MPFAIDAQATGSELSEAINYLLANLSEGLSVNDQTGQITAPNGNVVAYVYKYLAVRYADSFDGSLNFSNTPTNREYYGLRNTDSAVESTNPADYVWYKVSGGFSTTKFLFYLTTGGRGIEFYVGTAAPSQFYVQDNGSSIDLDFVTGATTSPSNFAVLRIANDFSPPTDAEVLSSIGRLPINGDLCIVNYNTGAASIQYRYSSGWTIFQKILTGDLVVANSITGTNIAANTITASNIQASTITTDRIQVGAVTVSDAGSSGQVFTPLPSAFSDIINAQSGADVPFTASGPTVPVYVAATFNFGVSASVATWPSITFTSKAVINSIAFVSYSPTEPMVRTFSVPAIINGTARSATVSITITNRITGLAAGAYNFKMFYSISVPTTFGTGTYYVASNIAVWENKV